MEQMLWDAACSIRDEKDAPKFKDYLLPLLFAKRLSGVFNDEVRRPTEQFGDPNTAIRAIVKHNPTLAGVIDSVDFNESRNGEREISDAALHDVEPDYLGRAYDDLLRKFAEGQGQSAGEFFTPTDRMPPMRLTDRWSPAGRSMPRPPPATARRIRASWALPSARATSSKPSRTARRPLRRRWTSWNC